MTHNVIDDIDVLLTATYAASPEDMARAVDKLLEMVDQRQIERSAAADIFLRALQKELQRLQPDRDDEFLRKLVDAIYSVDAIGAMPVLDAVAHVHTDASTRSAAEAVVKYFSSSLARFWKETPIDQVSDAESRAQRLDAHCAKQHHDEDGRIQIVFNQLKGLKLSSGDPRWEPLEQLLDEDESMRVRYAVAFGICLNADYGSVNSCLAKALRILSDEQNPFGQ